MSAIEQRLEALGLLLPRPMAPPAGHEFPFALVRVSGSRAILIVASVMMPNVPSEPRKSRMKSGPEAWLGAVPSTRPAPRLGS